MVDPADDEFDVIGVEETVCRQAFGHAVDVNDRGVPIMVSSQQFIKNVNTEFRKST